MKKKAQIMLDIILPKNIRMDRNSPTDNEAGALYSMWKSSPPNTQTFKVPDEYRRHINAWKSKGLVEGFSDSLFLTDKGKKLIIEMVTSEPNSFCKNASGPVYSQVKAQKEAIKNANKIKGASKNKRESFNLKKERDARRGKKR